MKTLILMRHAKSDWSEPGQRDKDRPLNPRGRAAAPKMAAWLRDQGAVPDAALVSGAVRTRETWGLLGFDCAPNFRDDLYLADPDTILAAICAAPDCETLLVLGHNPGMEWMIALADGGARISTPTAWSEAAPGIARRIHFATPKSLP